MPTYAIGDLQGCYEPLCRLLDKLNFDPARDQLRFAGDLINRGPDSLKTLRLIYSLRQSAMTVLGNHDLHTLAVFYGRQRGKKKDTVDAIYEADDAEILLSWLRQNPLLHWDEVRRMLLVHAGIPPQWTVQQAADYAREVERVLASTTAPQYFQAMYGNEPSCWDEALQGMDRMRLITNYLTRMRFIDSRGCLELTHKEGLEKAPSGFNAWFQFPRQDDIRILFGHWAAIQGYTGLPNYIGLDTGCVWGGNLRAMNLDTSELIEVSGHA